MKIIVVIDNVRSAYNVGSIFRTADGAGNCEIYICGISPTPEHIKVGKTALGATKSVPWKYFKTTSQALDAIRKENIEIISIETGDNAIDYREYSYPQTVAIVLGHETDGVDANILKKSDRIVSIPMRGEKNSLNVASAAAIILYEITRNVKN